MDATIFNDLSEQTARGDYRVVGVSRSHIISWADDAKE